MVKTETSEIRGLAIAPDKLLAYKEKAALALMHLYLADAKLAEAEAQLREAGCWKLHIKGEANKAIRFVRGLTNDFDRSIDKDAAGHLFFKDLGFLGNISDALMQCDLSASDEVKILSHLKNNYKQHGNRSTK